MTEQKYARPPIEQAVIEAQFVKHTSAAKLKKFSEKLLVDFPLVDEERRVGVHLDQKGNNFTTDVTSDVLGYKLSSSDMRRNILLREKALAFGRLAPYEGWDEFSTNAKENWTKARRFFGYREIHRLAIRYINRIDIPTESGVPLEESEYLNVNLNVPVSTVNFIYNYKCEFTFKLPNDALCTVRSGVVPSPVVNHMSLLLDMDLYKFSNLPKNDDGIWDFFEELRVHKNALFEDFITDKARDLFNREID